MTKVDVFGFEDSQGWTQKQVLRHALEIARVRGGEFHFQARCVAVEGKNSVPIAGPNPIVLTVYTINVYGHELENPNV